MLLVSKPIPLKGLWKQTFSGPFSQHSHDSRYIYRTTGAPNGASIDLSHVLLKTWITGLEEDEVLPV